MSELADRIVDLYRRHAQTWAEARGAKLIEGTWLDRFVALLPEGAEILDLGCGPGVPIGRALVARGYALTGVDAAPEMITLFETNLPGQEAVVADMRSLRLHRLFDGVLAWDSFFHLSPAAQRGMFRIFRAHAKPGAALMFTSGPALGEAIGELEGEPLYHASLGADAYRALLDQSGFEVVCHALKDPDCGGHSVWLAQRT